MVFWCSRETRTKRFQRHANKPQRKTGISAAASGLCALCQRLNDNIRADNGDVYCSVQNGSMQLGTKFTRCTFRSFWLMAQWTREGHVCSFHTAASGGDFDPFTSRGRDAPALNRFPGARAHELAIFHGTVCFRFGRSLHISRYCARYNCYNPLLFLK